jgi:hypothetical protein
VEYAEYAEAQPGGLPEISRGLRSAATIPPVARHTNLQHPGGVPEPHDGERTWRAPRNERAVEPRQAPFPDGAKSGCCPLKAIRGHKIVPRGRTILAPFQGAFGFQLRSGGIAGAQPPAKLWQPFRLAWSGCRYVERHTLSTRRHKLVKIRRQPELGLRAVEQSAALVLAY